LRDKTGTKQLGYNSKDRTTGTERQGRNSRDRTARPEPGVYGIYWKKPPTPSGGRRYRLLLIGGKRRQGVKYEKNGKEKGGKTKNRN
jgi:hypothetical protein